MRVSGFGLAAVVFAACGVAYVTPAGASLSDTEKKCSATLAKSYAKLQNSILKTKAACHADDISGEVPNPTACATLSQDGIDAINKARAKFSKSVTKACSSECTSDVACVTSLNCPAQHLASPPNSGNAEACDGFDLSDLDWPGPYCESILGHTMTHMTDLADCMLALVDLTAEPIHEAIYADLDESSGLTEHAAECVAAIDKSVQKTLLKAYTATAKCRDLRRLSDPETAWSCALDDTEETIPAIQKVIDKLSDTIAKSCTNADIASLDGLCAASGATPTTVEDAQNCLEAMVREVATAEHDKNHHVYSVIGMLNATHPASAAPYCGDGIVTATREEHTGVGEECDGDADAACGAGSCFPPGDLFECTCDNKVRERFIVDGDAAHTDSDAGWKGSSHDATHNDGFGYLTELTGCDCSQFTQATCTGSTAQSVCNVYGNMAPRCSDDLSGTETCDERGDGDDEPENSDCFKCDTNSLNPGTFCGNGINTNPTNQNACQSQCFDDLTGNPLMPAVPCLRQTDCEKGQSCLGRCDDTITCNKMTEGSPLPQVSAEIGVCIMLEYKTDITGTKDIVSGETALNYATRSLIRYGNTNTVPCPVCAGLCVGGDDAGDYCHGRCNVSDAPCLVAEDCTGGGDTACLETDDECAGGYCSLELRCWNGSNAGGLCRLDYESPLGPVSHDCLPNGGNVSGAGVQQNFGTVTTGAVQHPAGAPCTNTTWRNYDCPCPADEDDGPCSSGQCQGKPSSVCSDNTDCVIVGVPTQPNGCAAACSGGVNAGKGCVTLNGGFGSYSTCVLGTDAGLPCDDNADCEGGSCTGNPKQCTAGTVALGTGCNLNSDCGIGGVCADACPGGFCVPLCMPEGKCTGGGRDGDPCATTEHCKECTAGNASLIGEPCTSNSECNTSFGSGDGVCQPAPGVTCDVADNEDGLCAAGPVKYRCTGEGHTTEPCSLEYGTCSPTAICIAGTTHQGATCPNDAFCGTGGVCSRRCTMGSPDKRNLACSADSECIDTANVPVSKNCEDGADALPGTADDIVGAGVCEPRPQDCFYNNGYAQGGGTADNPQLVAAFCAPPNASSSTINDASGFGGPSRIRRTGASTVNVPNTP
ncbi:MAG TPA: hypothetical protein VN634_10560 [Candidatus Limnocylindrales bacterium]|nr:hypothetical protein [Candidatus Limnocylindrales bacterium]